MVRSRKAIGSVILSLHTPSSYGSRAFEGNYLYNPYLQFAPTKGTPGVTCEESTESKTVKEATAATLFGVAKVLLSGGLSSKKIGDQAKQLFMTETVLLEWGGKAAFRALGLE